MRKYGYILFGYCALATFLLIGVCCNFRFEETLKMLDSNPAEFGSPEFTEFTESSSGGQYFVHWDKLNYGYSNPTIFLISPLLVLGLVGLIWIMPEGET